MFLESLRTDLLNGGGQLQTQLNDFVLGGCEVTDPGQWSSADREQDTFIIWTITEENGISISMCLEFKSLRLELNLLPCQLVLFPFPDR